MASYAGEDEVLLSPSPNPPSNNRNQNTSSGTERSYACSWLLRPFSVGLNANEDAERQDTPALVGEASAEPVPDSGSDSELLHDVVAAPAACDVQSQTSEAAAGESGRISDQDGSLGAINLGIAIVGVSIALTMSIYLTVGQTIPTWPYMQELLQTVGIVGASGCIFHLLREAFNPYKTADLLEVPNQPPTVGTGRIGKFLPVIGIYIFSIGSFCLDSMRTIAYSECLQQSVLDAIEDTGPQCNKTRYVTIYASSVVYHVARIIFAVILNAFCTICKRSSWTFFRRSLTTYRFMSIIVVVSCFWISSQMYESRHIFSAEPESCYENLVLEHILGSNCPVANATFNNTSDINMLRQCLCKDTKVFHEFNGWAFVLYTLSIEYCLLVMEHLISLFFSMKSKPADNPNTQGRYDVRDWKGGFVGFLVFGAAVALLLVLVPVAVYLHNNQQHEPLNNVGWIYEKTDFGESGRNRGQTPDYMESNAISISVLYYAARIIVFAVMIGATLLGFFATRNKRLNGTPSSGLETTMLLSTVAFYIYITFSIVASHGVIHDSSITFPPEQLARLVIAESVITGVQVFLQMPFLYHCKQLSTSEPTGQDGQPTYQDGQPSIEYRHNNQRGQVINYQAVEPTSQDGPPTSQDDNMRFYRRTVIVLMVANLFWWLLDSFLEFKGLSQTDVVQEHYFASTGNTSTWQNIKTLTAPFMLFFRFNSALLLASYLLGHRGH